MVPRMSDEFEDFKKCDFGQLERFFMSTLVPIPKMGKSVSNEEYGPHRGLITSNLRYEFQDTGKSGIFLRPDMDKWWMTNTLKMIMTILSHLIEFWKTIYPYLIMIKY